MCEIDILQENRAVGKALFCKEGLFYNVHCQCKVLVDGMYEVVILNNDTEISLGLCVPNSKGIGTVKRIPAKSLNLNDMKIYLFNRNDINVTMAVDGKLPFSMLEHLPDMRLVMKNGTPYLSC